MQLDKLCPNKAITEFINKKSEIHLNIMNKRKKDIEKSFKVNEELEKGLKIRGLYLYKKLYKKNEIKKPLTYLSISSPKLKKKKILHIKKDISHSLDKNNLKQKINFLDYSNEKINKKNC